ncbi:MAG: hypothetical protein ACHQ6U_08140 [Thermodesulfobacteriota bacterium]
MNPASNTTDNDVIPGQLKTIVLNKKVSISYSGTSNKAIYKIREIRKDLMKRVYIEEILESLAEFTGEEKEGVDFIVSSHMGIPKLYKIAEGQIHYGLDMYWIGNAEAVERVLQEIERDDRSIEGLPNHIIQEEYKFREAFKKAVFEHEIPQAGGLVFDCIGSPRGYRYNNLASVHAGYGMSLDITFDYTAQWLYDKPGTECYTFSLVSPNKRSLAVTGAFFEQSNEGFIYSPLDPDLDLDGDEELGKPERIYPVTLKGFVNEVAKYTSRLESYLGG